jgi:hypothetical protein
MDEYKICLFDKTQDINIYHFTTEILLKTIDIIYSLTKKIINYNKIDDVKNIETIFKKIINECDNKNILIIIDSILIPDISEKINFFLQNNINNKDFYLQNISIINITNDNRKTIFIVNNKKNTEIFRKIINVFPIKSDYFLNDKDFFKNIQINKNISKNINPNSTYLYVLKQKGGNIKKINIRVMNTKSNSYNLEDQWWFNWYFNVPPCAHIRLLQTSGTCWINSSINSLFMTTNISNIIKKRYSELSTEEQNQYQIKFKDFNNDEFDLKHKLYSLVYHLLINNTKIRPDDDNFIGHLASQIKCYYTKKYKKCHDIKYGEGGSSSMAIKTIFEHILNKDDYIFVDIINIYHNTFNKSIKNYNKMIRIQKKLINEYNNEIKNMNMNKIKIKILINQISKYDIKILKMKKIIDINEDKCKNINLKKFIINNNEMFSNYAPNNILIFAGEFNDVEENIIFANTKYKLCSATIGIKTKENHIISGIICDEKYFVYDSNNILVETNWNLGEDGIKKYIDNYATKELYKKIKFDYIQCLIYFKI